MLPLTFLSASSGQRIAKSFTPSGATNYPLVKKFTSTTSFLPIDSTGLKSMYTLLRSHAVKGDVLLRGTLNEPLIDQSRAGKANTTASSHLLVIDIDGWEFERPEQFTKNWLATEASKIVGYLPYPLNETSFIVNASASTGMKGNLMGLHIFFLLDQAVSPTNMANWLTMQNAIPEFAAHVGLSPSRLSVKWVVDPVVARPAQLIYIATPSVSDGVQDPFPSAEDRWAMVEGEMPTCNIQPLIQAIVPETVEQFKQDTITALRKELGLKKHTPQYQNLQIGGERVRVISNPNALQMEFVRATEHFAYWNINNGDSNAYYHPVGNPEVIYNFKEEPPFIFEAANKEMYDWYRETFKKEIRAASRSRPFAFRDIDTDDHWAVEYSPVADKILHIAKIQKQNIADWFASLGMIAPDPMPQGRMIFDPHDMTPITWEPELRVNMFSPSEHLLKPAAVLPSSRGSYADGTDKLAITCPNIARLIRHLCGDSEADARHFLNWLAYVVQARDKAQTAWILSGVPGTGKGVLFERVIQPIIGEKYAIKRRIDHAEDTFNAFAERALVVVYDEFRLRDSKADGKLLNKLKDEITATNMTVRAMRTDQRDARSYSSFIFFSNHLDAMRIEEGDRRFNVATPQRRPIIAVWPEFRNCLGAIDAEVGTFAGFLSSFNIDVDQVRTTLDNDAKRQMKDRAMYPAERFCHAVRAGDLPYFYEVMDMDIGNDIGKSTLITTAQKTLKFWSAAALKGEPIYVTVAQLLTFYMLMHEDRVTQVKLTSLLKRHDILIERRRVVPAGNPVSCSEVVWHIPESERSTATALLEPAAQTNSEGKSVANMPH